MRIGGLHKFLFFLYMKIPLQRIGLYIDGTLSLLSGGSHSD